MEVHNLLQHEIRRVDASGRLTLGREKAGEQYDVTEAADGTVTLTPVAVIPKRELWIHQNPEALDLLMRAMEESAAGKVTDGGDFTQFLDEDDQDR